MATKNFIDLTGQRFGKWTVESRAENSIKGDARWNCICDCGTHRIVFGNSLRHGSSKSCGCFNPKRDAGLHRTHNLCHHPLYPVWNTMRQRCTNPDSKSYPRYGGRGIKVCEAWSSFKEFHDWAVSNGWQEGLTIDRIDNDGNYCPENCRWVDYNVQANNTSANRLITYKGKTQTEAQWAKELGMNKYTLSSRINLRGWSIEKAFETPVKKR